jgi:hypothetical protein
MSSRTTLARAMARLALLCAAQSAVVLAWHALTRDETATIPSDGLIGGLGAIWLIPAAWLAAWQLTGIADWRRALAGAAITLCLCIATFALALLLGLFSLGLLSLPVGAAGVVLIALFLARREAAEDGAAPCAWPHVVGLLVAFVGLLPAVLSTGERFDFDIPPQGATGGGLALLLLPSVAIFLPHALLGMALRPGPAPLPWRGGVGLVLLALAAPMPALGPGWVADVPARIAAEHAEHRLFITAGGWRSGVHAGGVLQAAMGEGPVAFTVPQGWLALHPAQPDLEPARSVEIAPDPRLPPPTVPIRRLVLAAAVAAPMVTPGGAGAAQAGWHPHGCTRPDADGLSLCRQLAFANGREAAPALVTMLPEAELPRRLLAQYAAGPAGWLMLAPGLRGVCYLGEACRLRFAVVGGREMEVEVPAEPAPAWRNIRAEAARLLRDATGLELARDEALPF